MANDHIKSDIGFYLSGALSESRRREVDAHLAACEKCRQAMGKVRKKQARINREALKRAYPDRVPNLLLARLGKEEGLDRRPRRVPWGWLGIFFLILAALILIGRYHSSRSGVSKEFGADVAGPVSTSTTQQASPTFETGQTSGSARAEPVGVIE